MVCGRRIVGYAGDVKVNINILEHLVRKNHGPNSPDGQRPWKAAVEGRGGSNETLGPCGLGASRKHGT